MLRITQNSSAAGAKSYYTEGLSREDYYSEGQEIAGVWGGKGAVRLGLSGQVTREAFEALCDNRHPGTAERLTARTKEGRTVGYDINFHCPKSVSALYALTRDERILDCFRSAVRETMEEMEMEAKTRVRRGGENAERVTGNLVWGEFVHFTARPVGGIPDPHLHAHCFTFNATFDEREGAWKAGQFRDLKRDGPYFEAAFHARLASGLAKHGYGIERHAKGWEVAGVPESVIAKFSRRTAAIEALAHEKGITAPEEKAQLGAKTRERKQADLTHNQLRQEWAGRLTEAERAALLAAAGSPPRARASPAAVNAKGAMDHATAHCFERESVVSTKQLLAAALRRGVGAVQVEEVHRQLQRPEILRREIDGRELVTTRQVLAEENAMVAFAREGRGVCRPLAGPGYQLRAGRLNQEQLAAVRHVLESRDKVMLIRGAAGVGKTTLMQAAVQGIEENGYKVFTFAPSAQASRGVLRQEGFAGADTVARLLQDTGLQRELKGQVIWIDEAGLLGTRSLKEVFQVAEEQGARVVLAGDTRQLAAVERGDALRILQDQAGVPVAEVTAIQRQKRQEYKAVVESLSNGDVATALNGLDALGWVHEIAEDERYRQLAADYVATVAAGKSALVVSPTHAEAGRVTACIREGLREQGLLGSEERQFRRQSSMGLTEAMRADAVNYRSGDVVQFNQNAKGFLRGERVVVIGHDEKGNVRVEGKRGEALLPLDQAKRLDLYETSDLALAAGDMVRFSANGYTKDKKHRLNNGAIYQVSGFTAAGDVRLANGWVVGDFGNWSHGYCATAYAAQGKTVDRVFIAQSEASFAAGSREAFYVAVSRARESATVFCDDKAALLDAVQRSHQRVSARELAGRGERLAAHAEWLQRLASRGLAYASEKLVAVREMAANLRDRVLGQQRGGYSYER
jgi:conjugative relaxase-like TrwC/TraI family protein